MVYLQTFQALFIIVLSLSVVSTLPVVTEDDEHTMGRIFNDEDYQNESDSEHMVEIPVGRVLDESELYELQEKFLAEQTLKMHAMSKNDEIDIKSLGNEQK